MASTTSIIDDVVSGTTNILKSAYFVNYYNNKAAKLQKKNIAQANQNALIQADLDKKAAEATLKEQQRQARNLLAKQQSAFKAKLGASGLDVTSGSGQVVYDNLQKEYDMEDKYRTTQNNLSMDKLKNNLAYTNAQNLLKLQNIKVTQQKQFLDSITQAAQSSVRASK